MLKEKLKEAGECLKGACLKRHNRGEEKDIKQMKGKKNIKRHKEESVACDMTGLKLRVRCHSEAPRCLIFYHVIPALWIWSDCSLKTCYARTAHRSEYLMTEF